MFFQREKYISLIILLLCLGVLLVINEPKNNKTKDVKENVSVGEQQLSETETFNYTMPQAAGTDMQSLYAEAKKCVVKIVVNGNVGCGVIWQINADEILIVSNRHVLCSDTKGEVTFWTGAVFSAEVAALSQEYDMGLLKVQCEEVPYTLLKEVYEARHISNTEMQENDILWIIGEPIMQIGYLNGEEVYFEGELSEERYIPEFGQKMLVTKCYSKAGMSGGVLIDHYGNMLGMISGGEVSENGEREADITYSISVKALEAEFLNFLSNDFDSAFCNNSDEIY